MDTVLANPFHAWAELARGLRDRFASELRGIPDGLPPAPYTADLLGKLAAIITMCERLGISLDQLQEREPLVFAAFLRALEKS